MGLNVEDLKKEILDIAQTCCELESSIIDNIFFVGKIEGITAHQLKEFVKSRINKKLKDIHLNNLYDVTYNPIANWFYKSINAIEFTDFFSRNPTAYSKNWNFYKIKEW